MTPKQRLSRVLTFRIAPLSFSKLVALVVGLLTIVGSLAGAARWVGNLETTTHADKVFVNKAAFAVFQQGLADKRREDSTANASGIREMYHVVKGIDSMLKCDHGHRDFCR